MYILEGKVKTNISHYESDISSKEILKLNLFRCSIKEGKIMNSPKVSIIILNWNGKRDTIECLESLKHMTYPNYDILIVDNGSTDESAKCFGERYPSIEVIENGKNMGFAGGINVGIRKAIERGMDYVLLLNNDVVLIDSGFLDELIKVGESDPKIGILGPSVYYYDRPELLHMEKRYKGIESPIEAFISGCCFLVKKQVLDEVGLLDDTFFLFFEETDFFVRTNRKGYKIMYVPKGCKILHKFSPSISKLKNISLYHLSRSGMIFFRKNKSLKFIDYLFSTFFYSIVVSFNFNGFIWFLKGLNDGLFIKLKDEV